MEPPILRGRTLLAGAFLITAVLVLLVDFLGFFDPGNWQVYDLFFRIRGSRANSTNIVIAGVDEKTLRALGRWPIARRHYAELLDRLQLAQTVGLDIIMAEPSEDDELLAAAIRRHGKVVLAAHLDPGGEIIYPDSTLSAGKVGHIHVETGIDGIARKIYHGIVSDGVSLRSFSSALYESATHSSRHPGADANETCTSAIVQSDPMLVNYYGRNGTFQTLSFYDVLTGKWSPEFFRGKIVLVGVTALGVEAGFLTPFAANRNTMSGIELHANALNNLFEGGFMRPVAPWLMWSAAIVLLALFFIVFARLQALPSFFLCAGSLLFVAVSVFMLFARANIWAPPIVLFASIAAPFLVCGALELKQLYESLIQARREWEEAFGTIDDGIYIQNRNGDLARTNAAGSRMSGEFLLEALKNRCAELSRRGEGGEAGLGLGDGSKTEAVQVEELFDKAADRHYEVKSLPRRNAANGLVGFVHVVRDITLKKQAREEQSRLQQMLTQAQKMEALGTLAGGVAHDFNNILTAVFGYTELILLTLPEGDELLRPMAEQVLQASVRAKELVAQILTFSRRTETERKAMQIAPILKEAVKLFRTGMPSSITVIEDFRADCSVEIDPTQMHQVILNLCTNAYHAMKESGGAIRISLERADIEHPLLLSGQELTPGAYAKLTVADNGHGIPEGLTEKIFEPYFTTKSEGEGTGLGLATVQAIVRDHGGVVDVESEAGKGTSFHIYLPLAEQAGLLEEDNHRGAIVRGSGRILLIEDDPQACGLVRKMVEGFGYQAESRMNALDALELFRARPLFFDLVLTDFDMPLMSGVEFTERVLKIRPDVPILLCTGYRDQALIERARSAGIRDVVQKPFNATALSRILAASLSGPVSGDIPGVHGGERAKKR